ncbi:hypothetical protein ENUP19_0188G0008 [Entamoeba nuttalli]|uniref:Uncharacterized protein n=2 Tax=Entamoeba nuttalli TaxID=412467 RepID=K2GYU0_ENTNP|nr:hypothetical protein ENU1_144340 [Entamoeba nuttalli P19]EKE39012.1 hypothetical protein ENU1_144340 [Entamoeba nuttalli P19]|eukprot:XP_008858648.1 hypothetical protein ENU1_144340 [Entamoeba nuttalli P19]
MSIQIQSTNEFEKLNKAILESKENYVRQDFFGKSFDELHKEVCPYRATTTNFQGDGKDITILHPIDL